MTEGTDSLKVVVIVGQGDAELRAEIERFPPRARAARMRSLANIGLQTVRQGVAPLSSAPPSACNAQAESTVKKEDDGGAQRLKAKLRGSLG